jgi:hypothetical protein
MSSSVLWCKLHSVGFHDCPHDLFLRTQVTTCGTTSPSQCPPGVFGAVWAQHKLRPFTPAGSVGKHQCVDTVWACAVRSPVNPFRRPAISQHTASDAAASSAASHTFNQPVLQDVYTPGVNLCNSCCASGCDLHTRYGTLVVPVGHNSRVAGMMSRDATALPYNVVWSAAAAAVLQL